MDLELSADEEVLAGAVRRLCEGLFPTEKIRELESSGPVERELWAKLAEAGVFSLRLPEAAGGAGLGNACAALVFEELGRALVPGPLVATHLAAGLVEGCAEGNTIAGLVERPAPSAVPARAVVEHAGSLDVLVVLDGEGLWRIDPAEVDWTPVATPFDPLTPVQVASLPRGARIAGPEASSRWTLEGALLSAASLLGLAEASTDLAVAYAKERQQFGRPVGSFQAVKHILADMLARAEVARAAVYAAGATLDDPDASGAERAVSTAKLVAGDGALANGKACIQVHGGMGFTWEVTAHLYLKRARVLEESFGSSDSHAEALASMLEG